MKAWLRIELLLFGTGLCLLFFLVGATVSRYDVFPNSYLQRGFRAVESVEANIIRPYLWEAHQTEHHYYPNRFSSLGLRTYNEARAFPGATLFSAADEPTARLISLDGEELYSWTMPFSEVWPSPPHIEVAAPDRFVFFRKTHLYPNGDLLAIYEAPGFWPYAYGLIKIDQDSNLLWSYGDLANHDLDIGPEGNLYTLVHQVRSKIDVRENPRLKSVIDDVLVVLSPEGEERKRVSIFDALVRSNYAASLAKAPGKDAMHANSVMVATQDIADRYDFVQRGQVLLSLRNLSMIAVLDIPSETITWAMRGSWQVQHAARFRDNGTIGLFDNEGNIGNGGTSRIVEFDTGTGGILWEFSGTTENRFESESRGELQWLPNGNVLITESNSGRILEVTRDKEIVWEYVVDHEIEGKLPAVFWASRVDINSLSFLSQAQVLPTTGDLNANTE